jgi:hypothetical protein
MKNFSITDGPSNLFVSDAPADHYSTSGWTYNGAPQADRKGAAPKR